MVYTVTITSQGQISIPAKIRSKLGLSKRSKAIVTIENNKVVIEPVKDLLELGGMFKTNKKPLSNQQLHNLFAKSMADDYANILNKR